MSITAMAAAPSIEPAPGLVVPAHPGCGQAGQFALFSDGWIGLQAYAGAAAQLPLTRGCFEDKYGACSGARAAAECVDAMRRVQAAWTEFGDPRTLRAALRKNPGLLASLEPPKPICTHVAWLGQRVLDTAGMIASGFESVLADLSGLPAREQVISLKTYLFDQAFGPVPLSKQMADDVGMLISRVARFAQKVDECHDRLKAFTGASSPLVEQVNAAIGIAARQRIAGLAKSRDDACKAWREFTVAAATSEIECMLVGALLVPPPGCGSSLAAGPADIALALGLRASAARCHASYHDYCGQLAGQGAESRGKQRLRSDLRDFDIQLPRVASDIDDFLATLQSIEGVWVRMTSDMLAIGNSISESTVASLPLLAPASSRLAVDAWKAVNACGRRFTAGSLIDYTIIAFGDRLPEAAPAQAA